MQIHFLNAQREDADVHTGRWDGDLKLFISMHNSVNFFLRLASIGAFFQMNRTYKTIYINKFLPPLGFEPGSLGTVSR